MFNEFGKRDIEGAKKEVNEKVNNKTNKKKNIESINIRLIETMSLEALIEQNKAKFNKEGE